MQPGRLFFFTLVLLISFPVVNAVLFTPALPELAQFFRVPAESIQQSMLWFLAGYTLSQLIYTPCAERFGRKMALQCGIGLQIIASILCIVAGKAHWYGAFVAARFLLALGAGVGLSISLVLVNEYYEQAHAIRKTAAMMLSLAIAPGIAVLTGSLLMQAGDWSLCFYATTGYGMMLFVLAGKLPATKAMPDYGAFSVTWLKNAYRKPFASRNLFLCALLMGASNGFVYVFSSFAPLLTATYFDMSATDYGLASLLPSGGLFGGLCLSGWMSKRQTTRCLVNTGLAVIVAGCILMIVAFPLSNGMLAVFAPASVIYFGIAFIMPSASSLALRPFTRKAPASAVFNFINLGMVTLIVLGLRWLDVRYLPGVYLVLSGLMVALRKRLFQ